GTNYLLRAAAIAPVGMSVACWVKLADPATGGFLYAHGVTATLRHGLAISGSVVGWGTNGNTTIGGITISPNVFTHICGTYDGSNTAIYVNGVLDVTGTDSFNFASLNRTTVGATPAGGSILNGQIDLMGLWSRALTPGEVQRLYKGGAGLDYPLSAS